LRRFILRLENYGPFDNVELDIRPLTILIGKNSVGKSMLLYLLWMISNTYHGELDLKKLHGENYVEYISRIDKILNILSLERFNENDLEELVSEIILDFIKSFDSLIEMNFGEIITELYRGRISSLSIRLSKRYNKSVLAVASLIKRDADESIINIKGPRGELEIFLRRRIAEEEKAVEASWVEVRVEDIADNIRVQYDKESRKLSVRIGNGKVLETIVIDKNDVRSFITNKVIPYTIEYVLGFSPFYEDNFLIVDGRAGILRSLSTVFDSLTDNQLHSINIADREFLKRVRILFSDFFSGNCDIEEDLLREIYREFGVVDVFYREEANIKKIYVRLWSGIDQSIEEAPAGIREVLPLLISFTSTRLKNIFLEEPETHLHPGAVWVLSKIIGYALSKRNLGIYITTHSDYLVACINVLMKAYNMILEKNKDKIEEHLARIGIQPYTLIDPNKVSAYLLYREKESVKIENLVYEDGIDEKHFSDIVTELAVRREYIDLLKE